MYMLGPVMSVWLWRGQYVRASLVGMVGIFAKELAAAPLWIFASSPCSIAGGKQRCDS